jgi:cytochrome c553
MKNTIIFVVFMLVVVGFLYSISGKRYAQIPRNAAHQVEDEVGTCMTCHGEGKVNALSRQHPPKYECFKCHKRSRKR